MNKKKIFCITLIYFVLFSTCISLTMITRQNQFTQNNFYNENNKKLKNINIPKLSQGRDLYDSEISQNATIIRRSFESINFTVNVSSFVNYNYTVIRFLFSNNSIKEFNMTHIGSTIYYTYLYAPKGDAPLGQQRVNFLVYNKSNVQLNIGTSITYKYFTIRSNSLVTFNATEYVRNQNVRADILIDNSSVYKWQASVVNSTTAPQKTIYIHKTLSPFQINFTIDSSFNQLNHFYYVIINMSLVTGGSWKADYFGFYIKNTEPVINSNSIIFNPASVFRTERCDVRVNVSDAESSSFGTLTVNIKVIDPNRNTIQNPSLFHSGSGVFQGNFTVPASSPKGNYEIQFIAEDQDGGISQNEKIITVKNNPPKIRGFEINDIDTSERISVKYGEDLTFKFDVNDIEGISYVTVKLRAEDAIEGQKDEYEISAEYEDDLEIIIRTEDLVTGTWTVYISVTDTDGETTDLGDNFDTGPQQITIIPDLLSGILPWITLIIGAIFGLIIGIGVSYYRAKAKYLEYKVTEEKIPSKKESVSAKKPARGEKSSIKPEVVKKKPEETIEKKEPERIIEKRKIKRKL